VCTGGQICDNGLCGVQCLSPNTECVHGDAGGDGGRGTTQCVDLQSDLNNCGLCGAACSNGAVCANGGCGCPTWTTNCSGTCSDLQTDSNNCNSCGTECANGFVCTGGACGPP
jgi:hypothetical protein